MPYKINPITGNLDYYEAPGSGGGGGANLTYVPGVTNGVVISDSGTDATIPLTDATNAGLFSSVEQAKLDIALVNDTIFRGVYSPTAVYGLYHVVDHFEVLYQRISSANAPGIMPPSPEWVIFDPLIGSPVFDFWIRTALSNRLISQGINYQGDYNNGIGYPIDAVVNTPEGSPYGLPGQLFIRTTNPGNPGYPPGTASWEVYNIYTGSPAFDAWIRSVLQTKVTVEIGKGLSTEDYTTTEQTKLAGIAAGAEVNVNADWNATSGDAEILNKPAIPAAQVNADWLATSGLAQILNKPSSLPTANVAHSVKYAVALTIGQAVYVSSADGTNMVVSKADNSSEATSSKTLGLVTATGAVNYQGQVITEGLLAGLDTSAATAGDAVWLGTNGNLIFWHYGLTTKPVAPAHLVFIGIVTRVNANNGEIFVKPQNGFELDELHDVSLPSYVDKGVLYRDTADNLWKNAKISSLLTLTTSGTSGAATLSGDTLNIPQYTGGSGSVPESIVNASLIFYSNNC
jgi:hypothetical protein